MIQKRTIIALLLALCGGKAHATFNYDTQDRLTQAGNLAMTYSADGNILSKTNIGQYYYDGAKPHAVTSIDNDHFLVSDIRQTATYNSCGKVTQIQQTDSLTLQLSYGPEGERWKSSFLSGGQNTTMLYLGDYEEVTTPQGTKSICYLDGGVMAIRESNVPLTLYVPITDNLGSITRIYNGSGTLVFRAAYDAWGNQTVYNNSIGFHRGYCGHEMLPDFSLINMNGRLYDPLLGRFLSTDNFVQEPYDSQNFTLKYTDPSGEFFWVPIIVGAVIGGAVNLGIEAYNGQVNSIMDGLAAFGIGAIAGAAGGLTGGAAFGLAGGAAGGAGGVFAGMAGSAAGAAVSMPIQSLGNHIYFGDPMITGEEFLYGVAASAVLGGAVNGAMAKMNGRSFWNGKPSIQMPIQPIEPVAISNTTTYDISNTSTSAFRNGDYIKEEYTVFTNELRRRNVIQENTLYINNTREIKGYLPRTSITESTNSFHRFPTSFDYNIINGGDLAYFDTSSSIFASPGIVNSTQGFYTVGINSSGYIYHRCFYPTSNFLKLYPGFKYLTK